MKNSNVKKLVEISLLIALEVILTRFCSIYTGVLRIGFGFLPVAIIAMMYGPISAGVAYAIGDILGMNLCLDTVWLHILMGKGFFALLPTRIFKAAIMIPIQTILIQLVWKNIIVKIAKPSEIMA